MPLSGMMEKDPKALLGYKLNHQPGSLEKQAFGMAGLKLDNAQSARSQVYDMARPFQGPQATAGSVPPSQYAALRTALANEDQDTARSEFVRLVKEGHRTIEQVSGHAVGLKVTDGF